jgi:selenoprotein W-related protein
MRSAWLAQELLTTFTDDLEEISLRPSEISGRFQISLNDQLIFDRKREGHFPEAKEIKQIVRDIVCPERSLGHSDRKVSE